MNYNATNIADNGAAAVFVVKSASIADGGGAMDTETGTISMDDLYPALVQCFGIIICG